MNSYNEQISIYAHSIAINWEQKDFRLQHLHGVSSCDGIECLMMQTQIHSGHICKVFLQCAFYCGFSMWLPERLRNHSGHICWVFLQCVFFCGLAMFLFVQTIIHTGRTCSVSLHCAFLYGFSEWVLEWMNNCTGHIGRASRHSAFSCGLLLNLNNCTCHTCWASCQCAFSYVFSDSQVPRPTWEVTFVSFGEPDYFSDGYQKEKKSVEWILRI